MATLYLAQQTKLLFRRLDAPLLPSKEKRKKKRLPNPISSCTYAWRIYSQISGSATKSGWLLHITTVGNNAIAASTIY